MGLYSEAYLERKNRGVAVTEDELAAYCGFTGGDLYSLPAAYESHPRRGFLEGDRFGVYRPPIPVKINSEKIHSWGYDSGILVTALYLEGNFPGYTFPNLNCWGNGEESVAIRRISLKARNGLEMRLIPDVPSDILGGHAKDLQYQYRLALEMQDKKRALRVSDEVRQVFGLGLIMRGGNGPYFRILGN